MQLSPIHWLILSLLLATEVVTIGCSKPADRAPSSASSAAATVNSAWPSPACKSVATHAEMQNRRAAIVRATPDTNIWLGDVTARTLRAKLVQSESLQSEAIQSGLKLKLADAELKLGNKLEAIRLLRECDEQHFANISQGWPEDRKRDLDLYVGSSRCTGPQPTRRKSGLMYGLMRDCKSMKVCLSFRLQDSRETAFQGDSIIRHNSHALELTARSVSYELSTCLGIALYVNQHHSAARTCIRNSLGT